MKSTSDKYSKYIVKVKINNKSGFIIYGRDEYENEFLLVENKKILLFDDIGKMIRYVLSSKVLPDKDNFYQWATEITSTEIDFHVDIDMIAKHISAIDKDLLTDLDKVVFDDAVSLIHIMGDFAYQTNNLKLIELYENETIDAFVNIHADNYLWRIKDDEKSKIVINLNLFKSIFEQMISVFYGSFLLYKEK